MRHNHRHLAIVVAAVIVVAASASLAFGCGGGGEPVDPQAVLSQSAAAMQKVTGFHLVYEVHKPGNAKPGPGLEIVRITADVNADGNMRAVLDVTQGGLPLTLNFVQVGDTQYLQLGAWQKIPVESSPVGKLTLGASTVTILEEVADATYEGQGSKGGADCYHVTGSVPAAAVKAIAQSTTTTSPFPVDIWVGVKNSYVYEVDIHGPATVNEPAGTWRSIVLSQFNENVEIKAPI